jgi:hypothetical protein
MIGYSLSAMKLPEVTEVPERNLVLVNGREIPGFVFDDALCVQCQSRLIYHEDFDSAFCATCNSWAEPHPICSDPECPYCSRNRPERPLPPVAGG